MTATIGGIVQTVLDALETNQTVGVATVIGVQGESAPAACSPGAKLLWQQDGNVIGSLGEESVDAQVISVCERIVSEGGEAQVIDCLITSGTEEGPRQGEETRVEVFLDVIYGPPTVLIVGGGHIGWHLARMAKLIGYRVVVVDDRPEFANKERFPEVDEVIAANMVQTLATLPIGPTTYVVLVTRGHSFDEGTLRQVIDSRAGYIGMIGSRARVSSAFARLLEDGVDRDKLNRIYAPIGLRIGAQTPEEIALSILAEIVNVRRGGDAGSSRDQGMKPDTIEENANV